MFVKYVTNCRSKNSESLRPVIKRKKVNKSGCCVEIDLGLLKVAGR